MSSMHPLDKQAQAFLADDGSGVGKAMASLGPERYGDVWTVRLMTTQNDASTTDIQLRVYRNNESPGAMVDSTYSGRQATSPTELELRAGEKLIFVWSKGDIGTLCTVRVEGDMYSGRTT